MNFRRIFIWTPAEKNIPAPVTNLVSIKTLSELNTSPRRRSFLAGLLAAQERQQVLQFFVAEQLLVAFGHHRFIARNDLFDLVARDDGFLRVLRFLGVDRQHAKE